MKTLRIDNIWKFATFNLYTVPGKNPTYPQRYSTDFGNLCPICTKLLWEGILDVKVSDAQVFYFGFGKVKTLRIDNIWKFATFNLYTVPGKNPTYPKVFNRFWKFLPHLEDFWWEGIWVLSFRCAGILLLFWQGENYCVSTKFESLPLSTCSLCQEKSYISKGIQLIFEIFAWVSKLLRVGICVGSFRCAGILLVATARWKLSVSTKFESLPLSTCTLWKQKSYIYKGIHPIFEIVRLSSDEIEGRHLGGKLQVCRYFTFAMARWKLCV